MIMTWLVNSMEFEFGQPFLFLLTAKELWDAVNETYSDLGNSPQVHEIKTDSRDQAKRSKCNQVL